MAARIRPNTAVHKRGIPTIFLLGQRASWHPCNRMRATESIFDRLQPRERILTVQEMMRVVRVAYVVRAHACAANRAWTWVRTPRFKRSTFQEVHVSAKSRWRIDLDSIPFESYKLWPRAYARALLPLLPSANSNRSRGLEKGRGWRVGRVCVRLVIWFTSGKNSVTKLCLRLLLADLFTA